jgi:general secretion pathway protein C
VKAIGGSRIVPAVFNGVPQGFKLYAIRPSSLLARLNFVNGDTVQAINGNDLSSPSDLLAILRTVKRATVEILRHGRPLTLEITLD